MHVNFNYQVDAAGDPRDEVEYAITELVEYRLGGLDFAVVRLAGKPMGDWGFGTVAARDAKKNDMLAIIGRKKGSPAFSLKSFGDARVGADGFVRV